MRLAIPTLIVFLYIFFRLVLPLPCRPVCKIGLSLALLAINLKYVLYEQVGGRFFVPDLPRPVLLAMETLYASMVILFFLLLARDILLLLLWLSRLFGSGWRLPFSLSATGAGLACLALGMGMYGVWQSVRVPDVRTVEIVSPKLPRALDGFSLVQLSDLHVGPLLKGNWLRAVVDKANALSPDVMVLTGDMIDGSPEWLKDDIAPLGDLRARYGVYGVTGNHEYYSGAEAWHPVFARLGVVMLHNEHRVVSAGGGRLVIAGVPDLVEKQFGGEGPNISKALEGAPDAPCVLLAHQPRGAAANANVDIQLSGHTHGGMLFFLQGLIAFFNDGFVDGLYPVDGMSLYVSPGTGLWNGFSCRVGVPSEITCIVLRAG